MIVKLNLLGMLMQPLRQTDWLICSQGVCLMSAVLENFESLKKVKLVRNCLLK